MPFFHWKPYISDRTLRDQNYSTTYASAVKMGCKRAGVPEFHPQSGLNPANALRILGLDEQEFRAEFGHTPLARPGWEGLRRNAAIVLGNSGDPAFIPALTACLDDPSAIIRETTAWAIEKLNRAISSKTSC